MRPPFHGFVRTHQHASVPSTITSVPRLSRISCVVAHVRNLPVHRWFSTHLSLLRETLRTTWSASLRLATSHVQQAARTSSRLRASSSAATKASCARARAFKPREKKKGCASVSLRSFGSFVRVSFFSSIDGTKPSQGPRAPPREFLLDGGMRGEETDRRTWT